MVHFTGSQISFDFFFGGGKGGGGGGGGGGISERVGNGHAIARRGTGFLPLSYKR